MMEAALIIQLILGLLDRATAIAQLLQTAQKEGRDITTEELDNLKREDEVARARLVVTIADAKLAEANPKPL